MVVNPRFNDALRALSVPLRAKEHSIEYLDNETYIINSSSESKGIAGTDGRMYMLDLTRTTPADVNFVEEARRVGGAGAAPTYALFGADAEAVSWAPRHGLYCLRKELLDTFCARKMRGDPVTAAGAAEAVAKAKAAAAAGTLVEKPPLQPTPIFNLDVFTNVTVVGDGDEAAADKALVAEAGEFLLATVIPAFAGDLAAMYQTAMDGTALTASMHARGINMRYLGCIASGLAALGTQQTRPILKICCIEMLARAVKHQLRALMKATDIAQMAETISQFLNCLVYGNLFWKISRAISSSARALCCALRGTGFFYGFWLLLFFAPLLIVGLSDADWCLPSDFVPASRLQVVAGCDRQEEEGKARKEEHRARAHRAPALGHGGQGLLQPLPDQDLGGQWSRGISPARPSRRGDAGEQARAPPVGLQENRGPAPGTAVQPEQRDLHAHFQHRRHPRRLPAHQAHVHRRRHRFAPFLSCSLPPTPPSPCHAARHCALIGAPWGVLSPNWTSGPRLRARATGCTTRGARSPGPA